MMKNTDLMHLQNGSDIRGIALHGVPGETRNLTPNIAASIGEAFLLWLRKKTGKCPEELRISIGRDPRISGKALSQGLLYSLEKNGACVFSCGLASTPAMFMSTKFEEYQCDGAIMITASHLPYNRNGFKFFDREGGLQKTDITEILTLAGKYLHTYENMVINSSIEPVASPLLDRYANHLQGIIKEELEGAFPLEGIHIVVDAGNGSGGFFATKVLKPLGANLQGSQFLNPDGTFPNHIPNPENKEAIQSITKAVIDEKADLGLIFDTDVDRSAAIGKGGLPIASNGIVALASVLVEKTHPGSTVVTDSITSNQLTTFLEEELHLTHLRYKRGYKNVINKAMEMNNAHLAIETSGHAAFSDNYFLDDGAYLATLIVIEGTRLKQEGKNLNQLLSNLSHPLEEKEIRLPITEKDFSSYGDKVLSELKIWASSQESMTLATPNYEGVRVNTPQGWFLLRKSLHDPILPLNIASDKAGGVKEIEKMLKHFLSDFKQITW